MKTINNLLKQNWTYLTGAIVGAVGGYLYWYYIGCASGTCPITASPTMSVIWGSMMGALLFSMFKKQPKKNEDK